MIKEHDMKISKPLYTFVILLASMMLAQPALARGVDTLGCGDNYAPTASESPVYPRRAEARGIEGYIVMGFTISDDGTVRDIEVVDQEPANTFVRSAIRAVENLRFPPCIINGKPTEQAAVSIKYDFRLQ